MGRGIWTIVSGDSAAGTERDQQNPGRVRVKYDWKIAAEKPPLKYPSFIAKPIFAANHRWAIVRSEESLKLELARRCVHSPEELAQIPPPGPTSAFLLSKGSKAALANLG